LSNLRFRGAHSVRVARSGALAVEAVALAPQTGFRGAAGTPSTKLSPRPTAPRTVRLTGHRREQTIEQLAEKLSQYVQAQTGDAMLYVMQVEIKDHNTAMLAANNSELRIDAGASLSRGRQRFQVAFDSPVGEVKFPVFADVVEARPAVIARREVPRGMSITAADVHLAPLPLDFRSRGMEMVAQSIDEVIGKEAARER
jgi:flagella basal body P-ring formation protein FlgA